MILFDSFYAQGSSHAFCQDYAWCNTALAFGALSDGCSAAPDSDVAARMIVHAAVQANGYYSVGEIPSQFHRILKERFHTLFFEQLRLNPQQSFATLHALGMSPDMMEWTTLTIGDGVVVARYKESKNLDVHIFDQLGGNAPYYLSYQIDPGRDAYYRHVCDEQEIKHVVTDYIIRPDGSLGAPDVTVTGIVPYNILSFSREVYDLVACFSDGVLTFHNKVEMPVPPYSGRDKLDVNFVLRQLLAFKNVNGSFAERRYNGFCREFPDAQHSDDFAIVASVEVEG